MSEKSFIEQELKDFALFSNPSLTHTDADYLYLMFQKRKEQNTKMVLEVLDKATKNRYKCNHLGIFIIDGLVVSNKEASDWSKYLAKEIQHGIHKFYVGQKVMAGTKTERYEGTVSDIYLTNGYWRAQVVFDEIKTFKDFDGTPVTRNELEVFLFDTIPA